MLSPQTKLGPYEILSPIGAGGMGEVYKARDTRLDRTVAIKVLPAHLADQSDRRERFEREARTVAALNHPHICTLHDIGQQDGTDFLVMEYVEGETLAARLQRGPLPAGEVLQYGIEIADALDKAHRKGVTHRDIKPGNIMLTKSGTKLLDFGLAKLRQEAPAALPISQLPTLKDNPTVEGTILGTLQYMSPEQLEGKMDEIDGRTDIFAFGAVMYEMATGRKAFEGKSTVSLIGAILKDNPPPISSLQPMTPAALDRVVRKCLAKEPEKRWQAASDVCDELKWIAEGGSSSQVGAPIPAAALPQRKATNWMAWASIAAVLVAALVAGAIYFRPAPAGVAPAQFTVAPPENAQFDTYPWFLSVSPDGSKLAFVARSSSGEEQLWLRSLDSPIAQPIPGTESRGITMLPFWSPDSRFLGFSTEGSMKKVALAGGPVQTIVESFGATEAVMATWSQDGVIVFARTAVNGVSLYRVSAAGGEPAPLLPVLTGEGEGRHSSPNFLPDGKHFLFFAPNVTAEKSGIYAGSLDSQDRKLIVHSDNGGEYVAPGYLLFARQNTLMAQPFDAERLEVTGEAVPLAEGVQYSSQVNAQAAAFSASQNGVLAYRTGASGQMSSLVWVSRNGTEEPIAAPPRDYQQPRLSPDGRRVAVEIAGQVWLYDLTRATLSRLTFQGASNDLPTWTPDGKRVTVRSPEAGGGQGIHWQMADGSGGREQVTPGAGSGASNPSSWSSDGQLLAFNAGLPDTGRDIFIFSMADRKVTPFLSTKFTEGAPEFSPDGHWLAYMSDESGRFEVYVQPYPGPGGKWQISTEGGAAPKWNPNGRELFYRNGTKMMAVEVTTQPVFAAGTPRLLFDKPYLFTSPPLTFQYYDVSRDGQRFLMVKQLQEASQPINVNVNWIEEMRRRAAGGTQ